MTKEEFLKFDTIYVLSDSGDVNHYSPESLKFSGEDRFYNGWGGVWHLSDYEKTWATDELTLLKVNYDKFKDDHKKYETLKRFINAHLSDEDTMKLIRACEDGFWGTPYGEDKTKAGWLTDIPPYGARPWAGNGLYYIWGWPGPDYNVYSIEDYGKTWALTEEELK